MHHANVGTNSFQPQCSTSLMICSGWCISTHARTRNHTTGPSISEFFFLELKSPCTAPAFELHIILQRTRTYPLQHELCTSMSLSAEWIRCCIMRHAGTSVQKERSITIMEVVSICRGLFKLLFFLQSLQLSGALPFIMYTHGTPMRGILKSRSEHCHNR